MCLKSPAMQARLDFTAPPDASCPPHRARVRKRSPPARAGGTAGRWARPPPIPATSSPPTRPIRLHNQITTGTCTGGTAGRWARPPPIPATPSQPTRPIRVHQCPAQSATITNPPPPPPRLRGEPVPSRRTLAAGIHALRSLDAGSLSASCLRFASNAGSIGTGSPLANPYSGCARVGKGYRHLASLGASPLFHKSPPARAGGTAGRWARPLPISATSSPPTKPNPRSPPRTSGIRPGGSLGETAIDPRLCRA
jgi:hypothetical protein